MLHACWLHITGNKKNKTNKLIIRLVDLWEPASSRAPSSASAPCLCMPGSVGILPPTAGSCSASLAHMSAPLNPHTLCMVRVSSPPTYTQTLGSAAPFLFCFVFSSADQSVAQPLDGRERDDRLNRSQAAVRRGRLHGYLMRGCLPRWKSCESESSLQASGMGSPPTLDSYQPSESFISP